MSSVPLLSNNDDEDEITGAVEISLHSLNHEANEIVEYFDDKDAEETEVKSLIQQDIAEAAKGNIPPLPPGKKYHLFVSYSSEDREAANTIRDQMERRFHLKCMDFERDFIPGKNIDKNIADEMLHSVKVLLILSPFYIQSFWCVTEAREACNLSFTDVENLNVIPLLLRPLEKDLPPFLKSYVYIDAQKELDVPAKIFEAFNHPGSVDPLHQDRSASTYNNDNGVLLCRKIACKTRYAEHGLAFRFQPFEEYEEQRISLFDVDLVECDHHYSAVTKDLNARCLFRNYPVLTSVKWRCAAIFFLFLSTLGISLTLFQLSTIPGSILYHRTARITIIILGLTVLCSMCPCGFFIIYIWRRILSTYTHSVVLQHNLAFYRSSKCLMYFDNSTDLSKPTLYIFRYDTTECEKYLVSLLKKNVPALDMDIAEHTSLKRSDNISPGYS
ncbi:uncharacterized protein LOC125674818 isoform X3 [Ostrea edulis]|uniref:uncharacterized protein LOC125674818 isoform X3 n=1 Tax=Ostrea edulis TaxID=37623 RepID=UPI0020962952|nr:uncharacterized protein LOC125674818 isoform X3 [Ostrea edulis]